MRAALLAITLLLIDAVCMIGINIVDDLILTFFTIAAPLYNIFIAINKGDTL